MMKLCIAGSQNAFPSKTFASQQNHMSGREDAVIELFRKQLRQACQRAFKLDMNAPLSGVDRHVNADEFFGVGGHFFLVEFK